MHPQDFAGYLGHLQVLDPLTLSDPSIALRALRARYRVHFRQSKRFQGLTYDTQVNYYELGVTDQPEGRWHGWFFRGEGIDPRKILLDAARVLL